MKYFTRGTQPQQGRQESLVVGHETADVGGDELDEPTVASCSSSNKNRACLVHSTFCTQRLFTHQLLADENTVCSTAVVQDTTLCVHRVGCRGGSKSSRSVPVAHHSSIVQSSTSPVQYDIIIGITAVCCLPYRRQQTPLLQYSECNTIKQP